MYPLVLKIIPTFLLTAVLLVSLHVSARQEPDTHITDYQSMLTLPANINSGKELFFSCTKCHGTEGWGNYDGDYPQLAGQHKSVIIKQMMDIRHGKRDNPLMLPVVLEMNEQDILDVASYISTLKMNPDPGIGEAEDEELVSIQQMYTAQCSTCHGTSGAGDASKFYPLLQGQNYEYLLRQLKMIQAGKRKNRNLDMQQKISEMPDKTLELLADYISRLEPAEEKVAPFGWENPDFQ